VLLLPLKKKRSSSLKLLSLSLITHKTQFRPFTHQTQKHKHSKIQLHLHLATPNPETQKSNLRSHFRNPNPIIPTQKSNLHSSSTNQTSFSLTESEIAIRFLNHRHSQTPVTHKLVNPSHSPSLTNSMDLENLKQKSIELRIRLNLGELNACPRIRLNLEFNQLVDDWT